MDTFEQVKSVIVDTIHCDAAEVVATATLTEDLGADSLDAVELSMALEEAFDIQIADDAMVRFQTVGDIVTYIEGQ